MEVSVAGAGADDALEGRVLSARQTPGGLEDRSRSAGRSSTDAHPRSRRALAITVMLFVGFSAVVGLRVRQSLARRAAVARTAASGVAPAQAVPVEAAAPVATTWRSPIEVKGTLRPWREADLGFETGGRLVQLRTATGANTPAGAILAVLDTSRATAQVGQAESQVRAAEASLALAEDQLRRTSALAESHAIPDAQVEQARQQVALAKAQLDGATATTALARTGAGLHHLVAPFAGVVTRAPSGVGSVVGPGTPLIHLEDTTRFRLSAQVREEDVRALAIGAPVTVRAREVEAKGTVIAIVPSLDPATRRAPIEIEVPNADRTLLGYGFVRATIESGAPVQGLRVPASARRPGKRTEVFRVERAESGGQVARRIEVDADVDRDGALLVRRGLTAADRVILRPGATLEDGALVDVK